MWQMIRTTCLLSWFKIVQFERIFLVMEFEKQLEQVYSVKQGYIGFLISKYKVTEADAEEIFSNSIYDTLHEIKIEPIKELKYHLFRKFSYHHKLLLGKNRMDEEKVKHERLIGETVHNDVSDENFKLIENIHFNILDILPPQYKRIYEYRYVKRMKFREIAELEGTYIKYISRICDKALFRVKTAYHILKNGIAENDVKEIKYKENKLKIIIKEEIYDKKNLIMEYFTTHPKGKKYDHHEIYIDRVFHERSYDYIMTKHGISINGLNVIIAHLNKDLRDAGILTSLKTLYTMPIR